ncbi:MAG TPA: rhodanese-like domain-containing protein [Phycisphaerae bacterium]|nr:rhodanese-like domain-containing protein [Phycisphaerales bacterium]HRX83735.1 rhodanese-like domain-containing protein [Phycisphaerae bacterium]
MFQEIDPTAAKQQLDDGSAIYLDVRSQREFAEGHVPGALNIPIFDFDGAGMMAPNHDFPRVVAAVVPRDVKVIIGCKSGQRSAQAAEYMTQAGWQRVCNLLGGLHGQTNMLGQRTQPGWLGSGLPVTNAEENGRTYLELRARADESAR